VCEPKDVPLPYSEDAELLLQKLKLEYTCKSGCDFEFDLAADKFEDIRKKYARPSKLNAFNNLSMLAKLGTDFPSALEQKQRDLSKAATGFELCRQSGRYDQTLQSRAEMLAGLIGGNYDIDANLHMRDYVEAITGVPDPFNLPDLTDREIAERLECHDVVVKVRDKNNIESERVVRMVSPRMAKKLRDIALRWIKCRPEMHTPFRTPRENEFTFVKALHLMNHMLKIMLDSTYLRHGRPLRKVIKGCEVVTHNYTLQQYEDFTRFRSDLTHEKGKPVLPPWAKSPPRDLRESDILTVGDDIVQPAEAFLRRQTVHCKLRPKRGIKSDDLRPVKRAKH
jgi:hypothetical protein